MRVQRLRFSDTSTSFTVVDEQGIPIPQVEEYLHFLRQASSPHSVRAYARALARWFAHLDRAGQPWEDFPTTCFGDYLAWLSTGRNTVTAVLPGRSGWLAPSSVSQHAAAVVAFYTFHADANGITTPHERLHSRGSRRRAPYARFLTGIAGEKSGRLAYRVRPAHQERPPILNPDQVNTVLTACERLGRHPLTRMRDRLLVLMLWETGMRIGEALNLRHGDVCAGRGDTPWIDVVPRQEHPHGARGKSSRQRRIYISDALQDTYAEYLWALVEAGIDLDHPDLAQHMVFCNTAREPLWSPMRVETVYQKVRAIRRDEPDLPPFTPHWLRHTHATTLLLCGTPPHVVMRRLGHADVQTTLSVYGWVTEDAQLRALSGWRDLSSSWRGLS